MYLGSPFFKQYYYFLLHSSCQESALSLSSMLLKMFVRYDLHSEIWFDAASLHAMGSFIPTLCSKI